MNTINDLTQIVHRHLLHLNGEWFPNPKKVDVGIMLGVTDDFPTKHNDTRETILDPDHPFWEDYVRSVATFDETETEIEVALTMLKERGDFTVRKDTGDGPGTYVTVEPLQTEKNNTLPDDVQIQFEPTKSGGTLIMQVTTSDGVYSTTLSRV